MYAPMTFHPGDLLTVGTQRWIVTGLRLLRGFGAGEMVKVCSFGGHESEMAHQRLKNMIRSGHVTYTHAADAALAAVEGSSR
jgi:hypothetical protein